VIENRLANRGDAVTAAYWEGVAEALWWVNGQCANDGILPDMLKNEGF